MPFITNEQLKGNFAENLVAEWLSRVCLVRHVTAGTDIGVDLYCESVVENNPYLHFWIQVKTISDQNITKKDGVEYASFRFERNHLEYWSHQPIPVYVFLVPVIGWPPKYPKRIYGVPVTRYLIENELPETDTITIRTSDCTEFKSIDEDWNQFISTIVPSDSAISLLRKGLVADIDFRNPTSKYFPRGFALKYSEEILDKVRDAAIILGSETLEGETDDFKGTRQTCEMIVSLFTIRIHELGINFLVQSAMKDKDIPRALGYINSIQNEVLSRKDIDEVKKADHIAKLDKIKQDIVKL